MLTITTLNSVYKVSGRGLLYRNGECFGLLVGEVEFIEQPNGTQVAKFDFEPVTGGNVKWLVTSTVTNITFEAK